MGKSIYVFFFWFIWFVVCESRNEGFISVKQQLQYMVAWGSGGEVRGGIRTVDSQFSYSKVNHWAVEIFDATLQPSENLNSVKMWSVRSLPPCTAPWREPRRVMLRLRSLSSAKVTCPDDVLPLARYLNDGTKKQPTKAFESGGEVWKGGDCGICVRHGSSLPDGTRTNNCVFGE